MEKHKNSKPNLLYLKYRFMKQNIDIDYSVIAKDIGPNRFGYLILIMDTLDSKNRINFDPINLNDSNLRRLIALFKKKGFIGKFKLKGDSIKTYYLNPFYAHIGKTITQELFDAFDEINNKQIY